MPTPLILLHTSASHLPTFAALQQALAPELELRQDVEEALLAEARAAGGVTPELMHTIAARLEAYAAAGARTVLCTCSTIGAALEAAAPPGLEVVRVDRPMAARAVALGGRILVLATLESTLGPTRALLEEEAQRADCEVQIELRLVAQAWDRFVAGDLEASLDLIATAIQSAPPADVIVLAQASMAGAAARCPAHPPILSSPQLGFAAALESARR
jgi:hypothetical protein